MKRRFHFGFVLLLAAAPLLWGQKNPAAVAARPPVPRKAPPGGRQGLPKGDPAKKGLAPRIPPRPGPVERLLAMPPEQRERVLEKLPPARQQRLRQRFQQFDQRPPEERARLLQMWKHMENLSPERLDLLTRQMQAFNELPEERQAQVRRAFNLLGRLSPEEREARLNSAQFKSRFSPTELQMISDIAANYPFPGK